MSINTDIWYSESDWTLRTDSFGGRRTNATAEDLEKYPKFYNSKQYGPLFRMRQNNPSFWPQNPTGAYDNSISYVGIQGDDLPQCNVYAFTEDNFDVNNPFAKQKLYNGCMPLAFAQLWDSISNLSTNYDLGGLKGFDGWRQDSSTIKSNQSYFHWSPNAQNDPSNYTTRICPIVRFGTKSIILEPIIKCVDMLENWNSSDGSHFTEYTLSEFESLSQETIDGLYILGGYCRGYDRREPNKYNCLLNADIQRGLIAQFLSDWEFKDFECVGYADNLEHVFTQDTYACILPLFGRLNINQGGYTNDSMYDNMFFSSKAYVTLLNSKFDTIKSGIYFGVYLKKERDNYIKENVLEMFKRATAAYGLFFWDGASNFNLNNIDDYAWISEHMYCGLIDDSGLTHGDYTNGVFNTTTRTFEWADSLQTTYDPSVPHPVHPTNNYSNVTQSHSIGDLATLTKRYIISSTAVLSLGAELWKISGDIAEVDPNDKYKNYAEMITDTFLTNSPIGAIVSLQRFPMSIPHSAVTPENIKLGKVTSSVAGYPMEKAAYEYAFEKIPIYPKFVNSFLDYSPYTQFELYIPFCGTVSLDPAEILGRELWCKLIVDFCTGSCTGYVYSDDLLLHTQTGKLAIDIPVTGTDTATVNSSISNASTAYRQQSIANIGGQLTSGMKLLAELQNTDNPFFETNMGRNIIGGMQSGAVNAIKKSQLQYDLTHIQIPLHVIGSASGVGLWACDLDCRLIIYYPTGKVIDSLDPAPEFNKTAIDDFSALNGLATCETGLISEYTGYLQCTDTRLNNITTNTSGYNATSTEIQLIHSALTAGIKNNT